MSHSSSKTHLHLHVGTTTTSSDTAATTANPACAACRYQRRRCTRDCLLAPYFPADQNSRFLNAHRLFGVSNMAKTLKKIEPKYAPDAMRSLIYEAEARAADPVHGCVGVIQELCRQMHDAEMELQFVTQQSAICRQASATDGGGLISDPAAAMILPAANGHPEVAGQQDEMAAAVAAICAAQQPSISAGDLRNNPSSPHQQPLYDYFCYNNGAAGDVATSDDADGGMQQYGFADGTVKAVALEEQMGQHCQIQASPFVDVFNVKPQILPPATIQYHGAAVAGDLDVLPPRQKKLGAPFKLEHDDVNEATAGAPCHLELGFSSSFCNA